MSSMFFFAIFTAVDLIFFICQNKDMIQFLFDRGAKDVTAICLLGTPEGVAAIEAMAGDRDVTLVLGALDERLDEKGYIVPGLGDAGDRLYGTV